MTRYCLCCIPPFASEDEELSPAHSWLQPASTEPSACGCKFDRYASKVYPCAAHADWLRNETRAAYLAGLQDAETVALEVFMNFKPNKTHRDCYYAGTGATRCVNMIRGLKEKLHMVTS